MDAGDPLPPHGFYPVSLNLVGRTCVVIGAADDREAIEKVAALREVDAEVRWITDPAALRDDDVAGAFFVISTPPDAALSGRLRALADEHKFLLCTIDQPRYGFVAMQAIVRSSRKRCSARSTASSRASSTVSRNRSAAIARGSPETPPRAGRR